MTRTFRLWEIFAIPGLPIKLTSLAAAAMLDNENGHGARCLSPRPALELQGLAN